MEILFSLLREKVIFVQINNTSEFDAYWANALSALCSLSVLSIRSLVINNMGVCTHRELSSSNLCDDRNHQDVVAGVSTIFRPAAFSIYVENKQKIANMHSFRDKSLQSLINTPHLFMFNYPSFPPHLISYL